jgi:hypothetical protein
MFRQGLTVFALLVLAGCATTGGNAYHYDDQGDYYYGNNSADVIVDSGPAGFGHAGYGHGFGWNLGYGNTVGYGFGYGYGYGGYYGPYAPWYVGYYPHWGWPGSTHDDPSHGRDGRVHTERALRSGLVMRRTIQAPDSAKRGRGFVPARSGLIGSPLPLASSRPSFRQPLATPAPNRSTSRASAPVHSPSPPVYRSPPPPSPPPRKQ